MIYTSISIGMGYIMDLLFGDPRWLPHPVVAIGKLIQFCVDRLLREDMESRVKRRNGRIMVAVVLIFSILIPIALLTAAYRIHTSLGMLVETFMCYQILAAKSLKTESCKVAEALRQNNLEQARYQVSMIVGRDTDSLDREGIIKAAVETVAENSSDGVIAPLLYMALGGPVLGFFYKAVNTMDSMTGYRNDTYVDFGRAAARLDDVVNFIPARIGAYLMIFSAALLGYDSKHAWRVFKRDRRKSDSPNAGQTESVCAGALNISLQGNAQYFGRLVEKPEIGDAKRPVEYADIYKTNRMMYVSTFLMVVLVIACRTIIVLI